MTDTRTMPAPPRKRTIDYSKKYWWVAAVVVPLVVAVVSNWPFGGRGSPVPGTTYIGSMTVIENQYQQLLGKPLDDPAILEKIQQAIDRAQSRDFRASVALLEQIPENARVPAIWNNLGVAYAGLNDQEHARAAFDRVLKQNPADEAATANLTRLDELKVAPVDLKPTAASGSEVEPNDDIFHPNRIPLNAAVSGVVADPNDTDHFTLHTPALYRDILAITVENASTTLQPGVWVYGNDRNQIGSPAAGGNPSSNATQSLVVQPDTDYFVKVGTAAYTSTAGAYRLIVMPKKAYDAYEPNDDVFHPSALEVGKAIEAGIMDAADVDIYQVRVSRAGMATVTLDNRSTTLQPSIVVLDSNRNPIAQQANGNASGNAAVTFPAAVATYFLRVATAPYTTSSGNYALTIRVE